MALVEVPSLVLQAYPYSETSKILRLLTRDYGVRSVIAKGAQRPKSRFGGLLEPFTEGAAQIFLKEGRDLHTLTGFDLRRSRQGLGRDLTAFAGASLLAELVLRFATEEPHPLLFHTLSLSLDRIMQAEPDTTEAAAISAAWALTALLGYRPETEVCVGCGHRLSPDEPSRFAIEQGGVACAACRPGGRVFDPASRRELQTMARGEPVGESLHDPRLQRALLSAFLTAHLSREQPLRSLELFLQEPA